MFSLACYAIWACCQDNLYGNFRVKFMTDCKKMHFLHGYCGKHPKLWDEHLHHIHNSHNHAKHSSIQVSPFEACLSYLLKSPLDFIFGKYIEIDGYSDVDKTNHSIEQI